MPKVSVIMPAYNSEKYIRQAIQSILDSTLKDFELIVVDDGSTDQTGRIVEELASIDNRITILTQENSGRPSIPKNVALKVVKGEYVCFLDNDDYISPTKLENLAAGLDKHQDWVAVFHDVQLVDSKGVKLGGSYLSDAEFLSKAHDHLRSVGGNWYDCGDRFSIFQALYYAGYHTQSVMFARNRLPWSQVYFDTTFTICDDTDLWLRVGMMGKSGYLNKIESFYRIHDTNLTKKKLIWAEDIVSLHESHYLRIEHLLSDAERIQYRKKIAHYWSDYGYQQSLSNSPWHATKSFFKAGKWHKSEYSSLNVIKAWLRCFIARTGT